MSATLDPLNALNAVLETGDPDPILGLLAPGAVVWHNDDKVDMDAADLMRRAPELHTMLADVRIEVVRRARIDDGWLQQFVLHGTVRATGASLAVHRCIVLVGDERGISRLDEYVDPTFVAQLGAVR